MTTPGISGKRCILRWCGRSLQGFALMAPRRVATARNKFLEAARPCKLGTMPAMVILDGRARLAVGKWVQVRECVGGPWTRVLVQRIDADGYFQADR
jgi:hypothetical protein